MEVRCGKCGKVFNVEPQDESRTVECPNCKAGVFVPATLGGVEEHKLPPAPPPQPPRHILRPVEMLIVAIVACSVIAVLLYRFYTIEKPTERAKPEKTDQQLRLEREKNAAEECMGNLIELTRALRKYKDRKKSLPPSLDDLLKEKYIDETLLRCSKGDYRYLLEEAEAASETLPEPILVCDSVAGAHLGNRNVITLALRVKVLNEAVIAERIKHQEEALKRKKEEEAKAVAEAKKRQEQAEKRWEQAEAYRSEGKLAAALEVINDLLRNYTDTPLLKEKKDEMERVAEELRGTIQLNKVRTYVQKRDFDEALKHYDRLSKEIGWLKSVIEKEKKLLDEFRKALWFRTEVGDLESAKAELKRFREKVKEPFWLKLAEEELNSIKDYEERAEALLAASEAAGQKGDHQRALALLQQLLWEYPLSPTAKKSKEMVAVVSKNAPLAVRFADKTEILAKEDDVLSAIKAGLTYLAVQQNDDGSWTPEARGQTAVEKEGLTALVILPFIAEGNTHITGPYRAVVRKALGYLLRVQKDDGSICGDSPKALYSHAFATLALSELFGTTRDSSVGDVMRKAVKYAISRKEPASGWRSGGAEEDPVLTAWMMIALSSAAAYDGSISPSDFSNGLVVFDVHADKEGRIDYVKPKEAVERLTEEFQAMLAKTAAAAFARLIHTENINSTDIKKAVTLFTANLPESPIGGRLTPRTSNIPYWFFGMLLHYQLGGLQTARWWYPMKKALLTLQITEGKKRGAWDASLIWIGVRGGSLFHTALALLSLQAKYMHFGGLNLPAVEKPPGKYVVVTLTDGKKIEGYLIEETKDEVVIMKKRGKSSIEIPIPRVQIKSIEEKK